MGEENQFHRLFLMGVAGGAVLSFSPGAGVFTSATFLVQIEYPRSCANGQSATRASTTMTRQRRGINFMQQESPGTSWTTRRQQLLLLVVIKWCLAAEDQVVAVQDTVHLLLN